MAVAAPPRAQTLRVLLLQGQSVYDPSSGAAQSMRQMAEALAWAGCQVRSLCTTGCENGADAQHWQPAISRQAAQAGERRAGSAAARVGDPGDWLEVHDRGVWHMALITDPRRRHHWVHDHGVAFDQRFEALLTSFAPQIVLTFGAEASDQRRWSLARQRGARVVLVQHNLRQAEADPPAVDAVWVPSRFMASRYARAWSPRGGPTVVPTPLGASADAAPLMAATPRVFVTFVNPEPAKGVAVVAGLVQRWLRTRPQQPVLIVEGRAKAGEWRAALSARGVSPAQCAQVFLSPTVDDLSSVWAASRVVLMPSLVEEAAGRVALEAMRCGVVPVVSDRGALPETVVEPMWVQSLPAAMVWPTATVADDASCEQWDLAVSRWLDDPTAWQMASERARAIAARHAVEQVAPAYCQALEEVLSAPRPGA